MTSYIVKGDADAILKQLNNIDSAENIAQILNEAKTLIIQQTQESGVVHADFGRIMFVLDCISNAFLANAIKNSVIQYDDSDIS